MKQIGMVVAVEMKAVLDELGEPLREIMFPGHSVLQYLFAERTLFVVESGSGQIAATMATQFLITQFKVDLIINFGSVGGLTPEIELTQTCIVEHVVHYDFDTSSVNHWEIGRYRGYPSVYIPTTEEIIDKAVMLYPTLKKVICASGDKFIDNLEDKKQLHERFKADICDMEAAGIVLTCNQNNIPCLLMKSVSDSLAGGATEYKTMKHGVAKTCFKTTLAILREL